MRIAVSVLAHVDLRTGTETLIMALAVFYAWYMTAWGANWLDPDRLPVRADGLRRSSHVKRALTRSRAIQPRRTLAAAR